MTLRQTLKEKIREEIARFREAVYGEDVRDAYADIAETVCIEAMEAVDHAVEQGNYAEAQGDYAKEQGNRAKTAAEYAGEQGSRAETAADYANEQGNLAQLATNECRTETAACRAATQTAVRQTVECREAAEAAKEAARGHSIIYDPSDGREETVQEALNHMWVEMIKLFASPISAGEYDAKGLAAGTYDAKRLAAGEYDTRGRAILE